MRNLFDVCLSHAYLTVVESPYLAERLVYLDDNFFWKFHVEAIFYPKLYPATTEYNCVVWSPSLMRDITLIEQVERRFTKRLRGYRNISYAERLRLLNLDTLEARRLKFDLIYCYKIVLLGTC